MKQKVFIVSYVGLSDSEYAANGYSEVKPFADKKSARDYMQTLANNEIQCCKGEERDYEILENKDDSFRMSWCSHGEQIRIEIHEDEIDIPGKARDRDISNDIVAVTCYGKTEKMRRQDALDFYFDAMYATEGAEHERYETIYFQLLGGEMEASDKLRMSEL